MTVCGGRLVAPVDPQATRARPPTATPSTTGTDLKSFLTFISSSTSWMYLRGFPLHPDSSRRGVFRSERTREPGQVKPPRLSRSQDQATVARPLRASPSPAGAGDSPLAADLRRWLLRSSLAQLRLRSLRCSAPPSISATRDDLSRDPVSGST